MGTSISSWDKATAYFLFADSPLILVLLALMVAAICISLLVSIKQHEDKAFKACETRRQHKKD
jgi:hypothetical protein